MTWAMQELWRDWGMLAMLELGFGGKLGELGDARAGVKQIWGKKKLSNLRLWLKLWHLR